MFTLTLCFCSSGKDSAQKADSASNKKTESVLPGIVDGSSVINVSELEKAGFEVFRPHTLTLLIEKEHIYVVSGADGNVARFTKDGAAEYNYKKNGEGPAHFLNACDIFRRDADTVAVFDLMKGRVLYFDNALNYKSEQEVSSKLRRLFKSDGIYYGFGSFYKEGHFLALLGDNYEIKKTFAKIPPPSTHGPLYTTMSYLGHPMLGKEIGASSWILIDSDDCKVDIMDVETHKTKFSLTWTHPRPMTAKDLKRRLNISGCEYANRHGDYYVVQTAFNKSTQPPLNTQYRLYVYSAAGTKIKAIDDFPYMLTKAYEHGVSKIYFMDDDGNIKSLGLDRYK